MIEIQSKTVIYFIVVDVVVHWGRGMVRTD